MKNILTFFLFIISAAASAQTLPNYNWTPLPFHKPNAYIDLSRLEGDKAFGFKAVYLYSYEQISSAQMWGLSSVSEIKINCNKGTFQYTKETWTEKQMSKGKVVKVFSSPGDFPKTPTSIKNVLDGTIERELFKYLCR